MSVFDNISKKARNMAETTAKLYEDTVKTVKENTVEAVSKISSTTSEIVGKTGDTVSDLASRGAKNVGKGLAYLGETFSEASEGDFTKLKGMADATGDFIIEAAKDMSGVNAYNHYHAAKNQREEAERIVRKVEKDVEDVRTLANEKLQYMGEIRLNALKNSVGRFIKIVETINHRVRDKEYELLTHIHLTEGELKEMETIAFDQKKMTSTIGVGVSAAAAAAYGARKAMIWGVQKFASASTGTAIKALSGVAKEKATMAWLGGGTVAKGGGGIAAGASRMTMLGSAAAGITILTTVATVASLYYSHKNTEATQYLADVKVWEAKTLAACELMKQVVRRSDEIASLTTRMEMRCSEALDSLENIAGDFNAQDIEHAKIFQNAAILVKSMSQLCQTPLLNENGELNGGLNAVTLSSEKILNKNLSK